MAPTSSYTARMQPPIAPSFSRFRLSSVDAGHGWLIFALPPAEVAVHPDAENGRHELFLMCNDLKAEIASLAKKSVQCSEVQKRMGADHKLQLLAGAECASTSPSIKDLRRPVASRGAS